MGLLLWYMACIYGDALALKVDCSTSCFTQGGICARKPQTIPNLVFSDPLLLLFKLLNAICSTHDTMHLFKVPSTSTWHEANKPCRYGGIIRLDVLHQLSDHSQSGRDDPWYSQSTGWLLINVWSFMTVQSMMSGRSDRGIASEHAIEKKLDEN